MSVDRDAVRSWLEASCAAQGIPVVVTDAGVVSQVRLLLAGRDAAGARGAGPAAPARSVAPRRNDPGRVHAAGSRNAGTDGGVVEYGSDNRGLSGQVQAGPTGSKVIAVPD